MLASALPAGGCLPPAGLSPIAILDLMMLIISFQPFMFTPSLGIAKRTANGSLPS